MSLKTGRKKRTKLKPKVKVKKQSKTWAGIINLFKRTQMHLRRLMHQLQTMRHKKLKLQHRLKRTTMMWQTCLFDF